MTKKFDVLLLVLAMTFGLSGVLLADFTSEYKSNALLGDYPQEYQVDADQPENTNNCTMNDMEGSKTTETYLEEPNNIEPPTLVTFVNDVLMVRANVATKRGQNDKPIYPPDPPPTPNPPPTPDTPEPATVLIFCAGMCGILSLTRRKHPKNIQ
ncbi:MAG: PEP-CTERM sorting domain-containing protein [Planctomycetaceae bacterium]|nr:PEP-CTERM sorting domain-containing protein [Planctomycetaceae bacterium]